MARQYRLDLGHGNPFGATLAAVGWTRNGAARELSVSRTTVTSWRRMQNAPEWLRLLCLGVLVRNGMFGRAIELGLIKSVDIEKLESPIRGMLGSMYSEAS